MRMRFALFAGLMLGFLLFTWNRADAVITAPTPLKKFEGDAVYILVGKVDKYYPDKPAMMVNVVEDIKGKAPFRQMPINLKVTDAKTVKENQIEPLLKRFGPDMEIVFFLTPNGNKSYITFAFANGTWFHVWGTKVNKEEVVFNLKSAEPYFRKAFKGTTEELRKVLKDFVDGKGKLPELDDKEKPGFGPEYMPKKGAQNRLDVLRVSWILATTKVPYSEGTLFAVIPTVGLGAPLAILALLFPSLFGGVFVLFQRWMAFITLISLNSTVLIGHWLLMEYYPSLLRGSWWSTDEAVWFAMTMFTCLCALWAWRRQLTLLSDGQPDAPRRTELVVLLFMSVSCIVTTLVLWCLAEQISWSADIGWSLTVVMTVGIITGTLYKCWDATTKPEPFGSMPLTTEGVILGSMLLGHLALVPVILGGNVNTTGTVAGQQSSGILSAQVAPVVQKWEFKDTVFKGFFASPPIVHGTNVFAAYSRTTKYGVLLRLNGLTGKTKWECFGNDEDLKQLISMPCLAHGKLYFGEGFHDDTRCRIFCVDAEDGNERWSYKTSGQTESSPTVANGRIFIGAGNDGLYCFDAAKSLDAKAGVVAWKYPLPSYQGRLLRFGGGMTVVGDRLYCGTGVDRNQEGDKGESAVFCFDAINGKPLWKTAAPFPVWSTPVFKDGLLYVTSGNGDVFQDAKAPDTPGGALQCFDTETGVQKWRITLPNGVIGSPAVDAHRIYFGCRDGNVYCVNRSDGAERWKRPMGTAVVAAPVLDCDPVYERSLSVFAASSAGKICCLNPHNGDIVWTFDLTDKRALVITTPRLVVTRTADGYARQLYFGCGLGGGFADVNANRPVFYCLEDTVKVE